MIAPTLKRHSSGLLVPEHVFAPVHPVLPSYAPLIQTFFRPKLLNAIAHVQTATTNGFQNATQLTTGTFGATPTSGNVGVVVLYIQDGFGHVVTPPAGWSAVTGINGDNGVDAQISAFYKVFGGSESTSYTFTWTGNSFNSGSIAVEYSGVDTSTPIDVSGGAIHFDPPFTTTWSEASITTVTNNALDIVLVNCKSQGPGFTIDQGGYTERVDQSTLAYYDGIVATAGATGARTGTNPSWSRLTGSFALRPTVTVTREQEGYRFRADDGSESTATWLASQDSNISRDKLTPARLRILTDVTNDPPSEAFKLQYRKVGDPLWRDL